MTKIEQQLENIYLITEKTKNYANEIRGIWPKEKVFICDFSLADLDQTIKEGKTVDRIGRCLVWQDLIMVDHHSPHPDMSKQISSVSLAYDLRKNHPDVFADDFVVVINHTDTDSILSAFMIAGLIEPEKKWVKAGIAADHTGDNNKIAELLQSLQNRRDLKLSGGSLMRLVNGEALEKEVEAEIASYRAKKNEAKQLYAAGLFKHQGMITYAIMNHAYDFVNFLPLIPEAQILMMFYPSAKDPTKLYVKIRLGQSAPDWLKLNQLNFSGKDNFNFGARWNAGSNGRSAGTDKSPEEVVAIVNQAAADLKTKKIR